MKIQITINDLKTIFKACKHAICKDDVKPIQTTIQLDCKSGTCKATALDGYRMRVIKVPYSGDEGVLYIPIIPIPKSSWNYDVTIEDGKKEISIDFLAEKRVVQKVDGAFPKLDHVVFEKTPILTIGFNSTYLKEAIDSFGERKVIRLQFFGETAPCIINDEEDNFSLVSPVCLQKNQYK